MQNKQYIEQHNNWKSAGRATSWLVIPWRLPYNRGKSTEKPRVRVAASKNTSFGGRSNGIRPLSRSKLKFEVSIKKDFKDVGWEIVD